VANHNKERNAILDYDWPICLPFTSYYAFYIASYIIASYIALRFCMCFSGNTLALTSILSDIS